MGRTLAAREAFAVILSRRWGWTDAEGVYQDLPDGSLRMLGSAATRWQAALFMEEELPRLREECPRMLVTVVDGASGARVLESLWTGGGP